MKKIILSAAAVLMLFSCQNDVTETATDASVLSQRGCASHEVLQAQMKADPTLALRMNKIEAFTQKAMLTSRLVNGKVEIHPMMYVALSYDHRIIDGRESVGFLVAVKEALENPMELLMDNNPKKALEL